jgi:hypothetical protein
MINAPLVYIGAAGQHGGQGWTGQDREGDQPAGVGRLKRDISTDRAATGQGAGMALAAFWTLSGGISPLYIRYVVSWSPEPLFFPAFCHLEAQHH